MRFADPVLQQGLVAWRQTMEAKERATADNLWFEERISAIRLGAFEERAKGASGPTDLQRRQVDYWKESVTVDQETPHTFLRALDPADLGDLHDTQKIIRVEGLTRALNKWGFSIDRLKQAHDRNEAEVIAGFLKIWNDSSIRDWRPTFAAFKDEVLDILPLDDWPKRLRDRLGLAHYDCAAGPIPIALMEYSVAEVRTAAAAQPEACAFTAPTALDSEPWPYFFPAPSDLPCGRTMSLFEIADDKDLLAEVLHFRITYERQHIVRLGEIRDSPEAFNLVVLRNHHLTAVRLASGRDDFGEEIA